MAKIRFASDERGPSSKVQFLSAKVSGENYQRPREPSMRSAFPRLQQEEGCSSEQVHLTLGGRQGDVIISFATLDLSTPSTVQYSTDRNAFSNGKSMTATGTRESYSSINSVNSWGMLWAPTLGAPEGSKEAVLALQNTYTWAYDKKTGERWDNWYNFTTVQVGLGAYNNPYMIYDSPVLHTVTLSDMPAGQTMYYLVAGSCVVRSFVVPRTVEKYGEKVYPFTLGLTGDLGQTNVSVVYMCFHNLYWILHSSVLMTPPPH